MMMIIKGLVKIFLLRVSPPVFVIDANVQS